MTSSRSLLSLNEATATGPATVPRPPVRWKTRVLLPAALAAGFAVLFVAAAWDSIAPAIEVRVAPAIQRPGETAAASAPSGGGGVAVQAAGWIEPSPYPTYVSALTDGIVADVLVLEGHAVAKGQPLARLVDDDAKIELRRAEAMRDRRAAELAEAQAQFAAAQTTWSENVERRRAADVAAAMERESKAAMQEARATLVSEEAMLVDAERAWHRADELIRSGTVSDAEMVAAKAAFESRSAKVDGAKQRVDTLAAQVERAAAENSAAQRALELRTEDRLRLDAARASADRARAELAGAEADLDAARLRVSRLEIAAPSDGVVMRRLVEPGSKVMLAMDEPWSAHIVHLYDPAHLQVRVDVALADAAKIVVGQRAEATFEALPNRTFAGVVDRVVNLADIQKNTLQAKVVLDAPDPALRPDMLARVRFFAGGTASPHAGSPGTLNVPRAALTNHGTAKMLWVVENFDGERGTASMRHVDAADASADGWVAVADGLRPGDLVVLDPPASLRDGARVRAILSEPSHGGA